jgi:hypothetical protein
MNKWIMIVSMIVLWQGAMLSMRTTNDWGIKLKTDLEKQQEPVAAQTTLISYAPFTQVLLKTQLPAAYVDAFKQPFYKTVDINQDTQDEYVDVIN